MAARRKTRGREAQLAFEALSIEGALLSPDWLARIAQLAAGNQSEADYRVPKGLNLRDEIGRYWRVGQAHWSELHAGRVGGGDPRALATHFVPTLLREAFGFSSLAALDPITVAGRTYPIGLAAAGGRVPVVIAPAGSGIETPANELGDGTRKRTAFGLAQEYLNAAEDAMWGVVSDGVTLRIVRDNASLTRPAWIEADLGRIFTEERYADFAALWLVLHETRFGRADQPASACALETWRTAGREEGTRAREHLRRGVQEALEALGQGFLAHPENSSIRAALETGSLSTIAFFHELLRLVYRLIFLLTVEERGLLHPDGTDDGARRLYQEGYGVRRLRERSVKRSAHDRFSDLWEGTKIVLRGVATGEPRLGLPALAGIFASTQCPALDASRLENRALLLAVFRLSWLRESASIARVNWRDMGPEELGSVYESLLELVPQIRDGRAFTFATGGETKGNARKTTSSYYTPDSLVQTLLDSALEPLVASTIAANPGRPIEALLELSIVDPACGSGHFLLAAARRLAAHVARLQASGTPSASEYRHAVRQVVSRCIYGVDLNPMAVELCKVSLWMEAVEPGLPLTFLNSHIQHGNALLGTTPELIANGIPDVAWEPIEGDDKKVAASLKKKNKSAAKVAYDLFAQTARQEPDSLATAVAALDAASDATPDALASKELHWGAILGSAGYLHQKLIADAWCAAFVWPKQAGTLAEAAPTNEVWRQLSDGRGEPPALTLKTVRELAERYRFFHWSLQFPQIFARGGFDVVVGNPPWDTLSPDAKEFFSVFDDAIRFQSKGEQDATIKRLLEDPALSAAWQSYRRTIFATAAFLKDSKRFALFAPGNLGKGDFNLYRLFVELALRLVRERGWAAQVVPDGLYAGANSMAIRQELFERFRLDQLLGFENTKEAWFPGVDSRAKFTLYSAQRGEATETFRAAFWIRSLADLATASSGAALRLPVSMVREFSPDALAVMEFRGQRDIDIARKMYARFPPLGRAVPGTAHRSYLRELESGHVQGQLTEDRNALPHYEGRMISQYDHRAKGYRSGRARAAVWEDLAFGTVKKSIQPQWFVQLDGVPDQARRRIGEYRVGFCDVASPTNERSLVAAMLPRDSIAGDKVPTVLMQSATPHEDLLLWLAVANSFTMDFIVRMKVSLKMALTILDSLPFPRLPSSDPVARRLIRSALMLSCTGPEMNELWDEMSRVGIVDSRPGEGVPGAVDAEARLRHVANIEAEVALLCGLDQDDLGHILDTFPIVRKSDEKTNNGLYRTKQLILDAFEAAAAARRGEPPSETTADRGPAAGPPQDNRTGIASATVLRFPTRRPVLPWDPQILPAAAQRGGAGTAVGAWAFESTGASAGARALASVLRQLPAPAAQADVERALVATLMPSLFGKRMADRGKALKRLVGDRAWKVASMADFAMPWLSIVDGARRAGWLLEMPDERWAAGPGVDDEADSVLQSRAAAALSWLAQVQASDAEVEEQVRRLRVA